MDCAEAKLKIQALIDKELPEEEIEPVFSHIESCYRCRQLYIDFLRLDNKLHSVSFKEPPREWYEKLEKGTGRLFFRNIGLCGLFFSNIFLLVVLFVHVLVQAPVFEKIILSVLSGGIMILLGITISDRIHEKKGDRYKGVVK